MFEWFKKMFQSHENNENNRLSRNRRLMMILAVLGILLIIIGKSLVKNDERQEGEGYPIKQEEQKELILDDAITSETKMVDDIEKMYEEYLESMLNKMAGVTEAEVMVNLDSTNIHVFAENLITAKQTTDETDRNGGERKVQDITEERQVILTRKGDQEIPLLVHTKKPEVRGVFVVAKGVDHGNVKLSVIEAVSKVLDVSSHRVSVMSKN